MLSDPCLVCCAVWGVLQQHFERSAFLDDSRGHPGRSPGFSESMLMVGVASHTATLKSCIVRGVATWQQVSDVDYESTKELCWLYQILVTYDGGCPYSGEYQF